MAKPRKPQAQAGNEWDFEISWDSFGFGNETPTEKDPDPPDETEKTKRRKTACLIRSDRNLYRRAFGTIALMEAGGTELIPGNSYHYITGGDVDGLSYLQLILLHQPLNYCLFSTWCMAAEDILAFDEWLESGKIKALDAYVGEIFPGSYQVEWEMLQSLFTRRKCGRIAVFRNHSKIFAGYGPKFAFGIETSANINTNPRTENGCITIGQEAYQFYRDYFDGIKSIVK